MSSRTIRLAFAASLSLLPFAVGCGGGSGSNGSNPPPAPAPRSPYTPNYLSVFTSRRKWFKSEVTVFVDRGLDARDAVVLGTLAQQALDAWSRSIIAETGPVLTFRLVASAAGADIVVRFVDATDADVAGALLGKTTVTFTLTSPVQTLTGALVKIEAGLSNDQTVKVIAHEFGHAIGIDGHSADSGDVMFAIANPPTSVTLNDANTLAKLYLATP